MFYTKLFIFSALTLATACMKPSGGQKREPAPASDSCGSKKSSRGTASGSFGLTPDEAFGLTQSDDTWADVKAMLKENCVSCHAGYDEYETAKKKANSYIALTNLDEGDDGFMPMGGSKLSRQELAALDDWKDAGFPKGATSGGNDDEDADEKEDKDNDDRRRDRNDDSGSEDRDDWNDDDWTDKDSKSDC